MLINRKRHKPYSAALDPCDINKKGKCIVRAHWTVIDKFEIPQALVELMVKRAEQGEFTEDDLSRVAQMSGMAIDLSPQEIAYELLHKLLRRGLVAEYGMEDTRAKSEKYIWVADHGELFR